MTPGRIRACYDAASIAPPANVTDTMRKSRAFVQTQSGTKLQRDARKRIEDSLDGPDSALEADAAMPINPPEKNRKVVVVHGRDLRLKNSIFQFLRSVDLTPIEWNEAVRGTGQGTPYTGQVVDCLFREAQAIVIFMTPDERVELRSDLQKGDPNDNAGWQPRANVFIEGGMAFSRDEAHTIIVEVGVLRPASDLLGRNAIRFDGSSAKRHDLLERLRTAGCRVSTTGSDWLDVGDFRSPEQRIKTRRARRAK